MYTCKHAQNVDELNVLTFNCFLNYDTQSPNTEDAMGAYQYISIIILFIVFSRVLASGVAAPFFLS